MNELPNNIDCNREEIKHCDWYMHKLCRETCGYAEYIMGLGVKDSYQRRLEERNEQRN